MTITSRKPSLPTIAFALVTAAFGNIVSCAPRKRTAIVVVLSSDIPAEAISAIALTIRGIRPDGTSTDISTEPDVFHYNMGMSRTFPGSLVVYQEQGFTGVEVALTTVMVAGYGQRWTHSARGNFVSGEWRQMEMVIALQCASAAAQRQCSTAGQSCGSSVANSPCVAVDRSPLAPASASIDASAGDAGGAPDFRSLPGIPAVFPWSGARLSSTMVPFVWRLLPGAVKAKVVVCSDIECARTVSETNGVEQALVTIPPGRYAYKVIQLAADNTAVGGSPVIRPIEITSDAATVATAIGTSMYFNPQDLDRDYAIGARNRGGMDPAATWEVSGHADTVMSPAPLQRLPNYGRAIANAGDFDGDGFTDLVSTAQGAMDSEGRNAYLIQRTAYTFMSGTRTFRLNPIPFKPTAVSATQPVWAVGGGGDINGDGLGDFVVGIPSTRGAMGVAQVFFGHDMPNPASILQNSPPAITGNSQDFGASVASGCDFDGDGFADFAVGTTPIVAGGALTAQPVRVFFGGPRQTFESVAIEPPANLLPSVQPRQFGKVLSCGADLNGDGLGELFVSDPAAVGAGGAAVGMVSVWSLRNRTPSSMFAVQGPGGTQFGSAMTAGVVPFEDNPNQHILVVAAAEGGPLRSGEVQVYRANAAGMAESIVSFNTFQMGARGASSLAIAEVNATSRDRTSILMGVPGSCVNNDNQPSMTDIGCVYALPTSELSRGPTTRVFKLVLWEPITGPNLGVSMAH